MFYLQIHEPTCSIRNIKLEKEEYLIGRISEADIRLEDDSVSRNHASLVIENNEIIKIVDLKSSNGTYVNGKLVDSCVVQEGDQIKIGKIYLSLITYKPSEDTQITKPMVLGETTLSELDQEKTVLLNLDSMRLLILYQVCSIINSAIDIEQLMTSVADLIIESMDADRVSIFPDKNSYTIHKVVRERSNFPSQPELDEMVISRVFEKRSVLYKSNTDFINNVPHSIMCIPVTTEECVLGAILVEGFSPYKSFLEEDVNLLKAVADQLGLAIERKRLQEKINRSQKMEMIGLMAGGVAHDLNNILSPILGYPQLLLLNLPKDSKMRRPLEIIQESAQRAADVVTDLLTIVKGKIIPNEVTNLNTLVKQYLSFPEYKKLELNRPNVTLKVELDPDLLNIKGSPIHIQKALMNLVKNAFEAIENQGNIVISTINRYVDRPIKWEEDICIGEYVMLTVSDNGKGIEPEDLKRIFEPFFSKKIMSRSGTGLGLTVVWNTVHDHNGFIQIKSGKEGTTFELYFPATREEVLMEKGRTQINIHTGKGEKILVVDDEETQRLIVCDMLTTLGYSATAVSSGEEAIEYMKTGSANLVILDMIMYPGIDGLETYKQILGSHPNQKAIIASGYADTSRVKKAQKLGVGTYIKKPYTLEKLGLAVKTELEKKIPQ